MSFDLETGALDASSPSEWPLPYPVASQPVVNTAPSIEAAPAVIYDKLILPGDFPDPTVTKIGDTYWASATSAEWGPVFPLLKSTNLVDWEVVSYVFPDKLPEWADCNFWAPEISHENGKTYICYTARKKGKRGQLCVAIASADDPAGPYTDHGPLVGQRMGSIDGFPLRDENGALYMVWKEDGNAFRKDTPIWAQRMNESRTALLGKKVELFRNDTPWEGCLVEGSAIVRQGEYFYMFYAGNGCCGKCCNYATGVARSKKLLGPWEKCPQNPILTKNKTWKCPGHGTVTEYEGRWFLLHHAYYTNSHEFVGRQGLLSEFTWNAEGWPEFVNSSPQAEPLRDLRVLNVDDNFPGNRLSAAWQWPVSEQPTVGVSDGQLLLTARSTGLGALVAQRTFTATYKAATTLDYGALAPNTYAGLAAIGDPHNALALVAGNGHLQLWHMQGKKHLTLTEVKLEDCKMLSLRLEAWGGSRFRFAFSTDGGTTWQPVVLDSFALNGTYLPPWDRGVRIGLLAQGPETTTVAFNNFALRNCR
ncbi:glycoside hydrolase family 43 [Hymenobacter roseosalivarius DSM 11622]|uniref:Glycoside hydrolase family 43 n=1 Tax=Hymenobacter roseosalivarius DSM 11622 TaxID=645990 RepID=A0A1W1USV9_9BACT|nr:family 43 glycosylhydrolase [Hymenobacter roseosalivarius]SMB84192.1 glycoside hydrolase family 43 [Hymenobacter roseosalivarius DSM 11622]